ncbi:RHS repeat domain-containing protein [Streptomyces sp. BV129]|uniref:RHS repeat domain-containing protein n=1 Tax=Streptomyces sp. BV129 TaxID=2849671 RepID=UPI001C2DFE87|nr:RHS repeat domain-containing protein [Streptomyces sp. BV129]MBV1946361.1 RHS repeat protein [Streptomyces sp. BV129]
MNLLVVPTHFTRDRLGRLLWVNEPLGHTTHHSYDEAGTLVAVVRPDGREARAEYDDCGLPTRITGTDGTASHCRPIGPHPGPYSSRLRAEPLTPISNTWTLPPSWPRIHVNRHTDSIFTSWTHTMSTWPWRKAQRKRPRRRSPNTEWRRGGLFESARRVLSVR